MCNLYAMMRGRAEVAALSRALSDRNHNQPPMSGVFPDYAAPVVLREDDGSRVMRDMRWGMPSSQKALLAAGSPDSGGSRRWWWPRPREWAGVQTVSRVGPAPSP